MTQLPPATVFVDIAAEVEIPAAGTLSRVLHSDDQVRLVAFAFDEAQELTEHTATVPAIIQVISGRLRMTLEAEETEARPGSWAHLPANLPHSLLALEPSVVLLTLLKAP